MQAQFPANPTDGMVYSLLPNLAFVFKQATNSWVRVEGGFDVPLATPISDGLMAATDLRKLNRLVVPAPQSTITATGCTTKFTGGNIGVLSLDDMVKIVAKPAIGNKDSMAKGQIPFKITPFTAGFDFLIDKEALADELAKRGQIRFRGSQGPQGQKGNRGPKGIVLPTGPPGDPGDRGTAPPCNINVSTDPLAVQTNTTANMVIVDAERRQISDTQVVIVLKRGVLGQAGSAPSKLKVNCNVNSNWILAVQQPVFNPQQLFYVDITPILSTIYAKYLSEVQRLKVGVEQATTFWLQKMAAMFEQSKLALCCSITDCQKQLAGQATQGGAGLLPAKLMATPTTTTAVPEPKLPELTVMGHTNFGSLTAAATLDLPAGAYTATISDCCIKVGDQYYGNVKLQYNHGGPQTVQFLFVDSFTNPAAAANAYVGLGIDIDHHGGPVKAYLPAPIPDGNAGQITVVFRPRQATVKTKMPEGRTCTMPAAQLEAYRLAWESKRGAGMVTRVADQDFVIVRRPLKPAAVDGELREAPCIAEFIDDFGQPAIAWPTLDGETFLDLPDLDEVKFKFDPVLSELVAQNLANRVYRDAHGSDLPAQLALVLFPII